MSIWPARLDSDPESPPQTPSPCSPEARARFRPRKRADGQVPTHSRVRRADHVSPESGGWGGSSGRDAPVHHFLLRPPQFPAAMHDVAAPEAHSLTSSGISSRAVTHRATRRAWRYEDSIMACPAMSWVIRPAMSCASRAAEGMARGAVPGATLGASPWAAPGAAGGLAPGLAPG